MTMMQVPIQWRSTNDGGGGWTEPHVMHVNSAHVETVEAVPVADRVTGGPSTVFRISGTMFFTPWAAPHLVAMVERG